MPVEINARVTETGGRKVLLSVIRDITERKAVQKQIADQLAFTEAVIHAEVNGLAVCHGIAEPPYVRFTVWNPSMEALTGFSMEEINHLGWYQTVYIDPEVQERARQRMERMRLGDHLHGEEWVITRKGGEHRVVQIHTMTVAGGDVGAHVLAVMHDITERKHAEMQLKNSEERYRQVMQTSMDGFWIVDTQGRILDVNDAYCQLLGYTREELLDMRVTDIEAKETPEETAQHMREIMTKGHVRFETYHRRKNGQLLFIEVSAVYRTDVGSGIYFVFLRDITERKEHEEELQRSNTDLEQFSYAVSHDMRQPLRMISSYLQLLEKSLAGQLDGEKRDYFNYAIEGAKRIDQMLVALLEYSRIGRMGEPPTWVESRALLDEALQFLQPAIDEARAKVDISGEWPHIHASRDEILRLLQNLIGNAIKYRIAGRTPEIIVSSGIVKNEWHLCVADNGVGIIPDQIKRLFQVFQRLQSREAYEGTGIGLALCRKIAEHHKGRIWAESSGEGQGSRFCVVLPVLREKK
jgi:PAS domain S-box-containing protein